MRSLVFFMIMCSTISYSQRDTLEYGNFNIVLDHFYDSTAVGEGIVSSMQFISLYNDTPIDTMQFIFHEEWHDCNSIQLQLGGWELTGSTFNYLTYYAKLGDAPAAPCGVRQQKWVLDQQGMFQMKEGALFLSDFGWVEDENGKPLLYDEMTTVYYALARMYDAYMISFENGGKELENYVKKTLDKLIKERTGSWENEGSSFGFCR